ncbi:MAG: hypothetical protein ACK4MG_14460 [Aquabacterium sp.]
MAVTPGAALGVTIGGGGGGGINPGNGGNTVFNGLTLAGGRAGVAAAGGRIGYPSPFGWGGTSAPAGYGAGGGVAVDGTSATAGAAGYLLIEW